MNLFPTDPPATKALLSQFDTLRKINRSFKKSDPLSGGTTSPQREKRKET